MAKLANKVAKKSAKAQGVVNIAGNTALAEVAMRRVEVGDVWGVGRKYEARLRDLGVHTAWDLAQKEDKWLRREFGVVLTRTAMELRGTPVHDLETQPEPRQSCCCSRSFGEATSDIEHIVEAVREFAQTASERLRSEGMVAGHVQVFAATNRFRKDVVQGTLSASAPLHPATADSTRITRLALTLVRNCRSYPESCEWTKAGVLLTDLCRKENVAQDLFSVGDNRRGDALMAAVDAVKSRYGRHSIALGMTDAEAGWQMRREKLSPCWTTRWEDLPVVKA